MSALPREGRCVRCRKVSLLAPGEVECDGCQASVRNGRKAFMRRGKCPHCTAFLRASGKCGRCEVVA